MFGSKQLTFCVLQFSARQKEKASSSVSELLQAMKRPRALSESGQRPFIRKSGGGSEEDQEIEKVEHKSRRKSDSVASFRPKSQRKSRSSMERISELPENANKNSHRHSFMG